jgi:hypothetical protein
MPRVADYTVIQVEPFTLVVDPANPTAQQIDFDLPANFDPSSRSLLLYQVNPEDATGTPKWRIDINGTQTASYELAGQAFRTLHEIVRANVLVPNINSITFEVNSTGAGPLVFSNIALLCHNEI